MKIRNRFKNFSDGANEQPNYPAIVVLMWCLFPMILGGKNSRGIDNYFYL
jgi:hypothetical protein